VIGWREAPLVLLVSFVVQKGIGRLNSVSESGLGPDLRRDER
jgi:hypothetical protein